MATWPFIRSAVVPPRLRAFALRRGVSLLPPSIGTLLVAEALCDLEAAIDAAQAGRLDDPDLLALIAVLTWPWRKAQRLAGTARWALHAWLVRPRTQAEAVAAIEWLLQTTETPARYRAVDEGKPSILKPASSAGMRMALRVAALHGAPEALADVRSVLDVPARDAVAWLVADDELAGAHFVDWETQRSNEEFARRLRDGAGKA